MNSKRIRSFFVIHNFRLYLLVISDIRLPGMSGMDVLKKIKQEDSDTEVLMMTGYGRIEDAVEAMKMGAADYMTKPFTRDALLIRVEKLLSHQALRRNYAILKQEAEKEYEFKNIIGRSPSMQRLFEVMKRVGQTDSNVLILGESGTGKELVARAIHYSGPRKEEPFVPVHCAALSEGLLESELFGHEKGAFTGAIRSRKGRFEMAHGGTLFLDEVGEIPEPVQVRLLRILQEKEFERVGGEVSIRIDARILSATQVDMEEALASGMFRKDLYYRLCVVPVRVPPLREREGDIPLLIDHFLEDYGKKMKRKIKMGKAARKLLMEYPYPGNVRELEGIVERGVTLAAGDTIRAEDLPSRIRNRTERESPTPVKLKDVVHRAETRHILDVLRQTGWNKTRAAELLGISRKNLWEKLQQVEVDGEKSQP